MLEPFKTMKHVTMDGETTSFEIRIGLPKRGVDAGFNSSVQIKQLTSWWLGCGFSRAFILWHPCMSLMQGMTTEH